MTLRDRVQSLLAERQAANLYRQRRLLESAQQPLCRVDGQSWISFCSNDYLGLANHPKVISALCRAAEHAGVGSGASHLVSGHHRYHHALEERLAAFTGRSAALLFSSGYLANLGVISSFCRRGETVLQDRLNHASLLDGVQLGGGRLQRYRHADMHHCATLLSSLSAQTFKLVVTDGVFSMDGDSAPLAVLSDLCQQHQAALLVDDAHGLGVIGPGGRGCVADAGLSEQQVPLLVLTLGKALGTAGAVLVGERDTIDYVIQLARTYIYTTALPPALAAASLASLGLLESEAWRRDHLLQLIARFRAGAQQLGLPLLVSSTPIQPLLVGGAEQALAWQQQLAQQGMLVAAIRPPTVPQGTARLRITLSAAHRSEDIDQLLDALQTCQLRFGQQEIV
jgi:8-amino-7-oxononanoate synthase